VTVALPTARSARWMLGLAVVGTASLAAGIPLVLLEDAPRSRVLVGTVTRVEPRADRIELVSSPATANGKRQVLRLSPGQRITTSTGAELLVEVTPGEVLRARVSRSSHRALWVREVAPAHSPLPSAKKTRR
jgi:hypothetical protein